MTFIHELDLDVLKLYLCTKSEISRSKLSKVRAQAGQTDRQTDRCNLRHYHPHLKGREMLGK